MAKIKVDPKEYVKKDTMYITVVCAVVFGFIAGVIYKEYISPPIHIQNSHVVDDRSHQHGELGSQTDEFTELESEALKNPQNAELWTQLGNRYFDTDQYKKAIDAYEKSLKIDPDNADVCTDLGVMYRRDKQYLKAISAFNRAINIDPRHEISRLNMGVVLLHDLNDRKGALEAWEGLLRINPSAKNSAGQMIADLVQQLKNEMRQ